MALCSARCGVAGAGARWAVAVGVALLAVGCSADVVPPAVTPAGPVGSANVCAPNPDAARGDMLVIDRPRPGDAVTSPVAVSGQIAAFEATFLAALFDAQGREIAKVVGMSREGQTLSPFTVQVAFPPSAAGPACLWVYQESAKDGSIIQVGQVPVLLTTR